MFIFVLYIVVFMVLNVFERVRMLEKVKCTNEALARNNVGKTPEIISKADVQALPAAHKEELKKKMLTQNVIMISGCQDTQTSADVSNTGEFGIPKVEGAGKQGGACTSSLLHVFYEQLVTEDQKSLKGDAKLTWVEMLCLMRKFLKEHNYKQVPMMSSSLDGQVLEDPFSVTDGAGNKRAVFIGINYTGDSAAGLDGCQNDALKMKNVLTTFYGFKDDKDCMKVLLDDGKHDQPNKKNIEDAMDWLISSAQEGDDLYFHYSGHGVQIADDNNDEADGKDEAMVPCDFRQSGMIRDDDIFKKLVLNLEAKNCRLFCLMDCCHSGSIMDLPHGCVVGDSPSGAKFEENENFDLGKAMDAVCAGDFTKAQRMFGF